MRNLKKFLALVLAMMMAFSLMVTANAAKYSNPNTDYPDMDEVTEEFKEAVDVLAGMGVMTGDYGSFHPDRPIMRSEMAAVLYRLMTGDTAALKSELYADIAATRFYDVDESNWFAPYVGWCYDAGIMVGSGGYFRPSANVTGYETLVMVLRAMGYGKNGEYTGIGWNVNASSDGTLVGLLKDVNSTDYKNTLAQYTRRDVVASIVFRGAQLPTVTWTPSLGYNKYIGVASAQGGNYLNPSLGEKNFGLASTRSAIVANKATGAGGTVLGYSENTVSNDNIVKDKYGYGIVVKYAAGTKNVTAIIEKFDNTGAETAAYKAAFKADGTFEDDYGWLTSGSDKIGLGSYASAYNYGADNTLTFDFETGLDEFAHEVTVWFNSDYTVDGAYPTYALIDHVTSDTAFFADDNTKVGKTDNANLGVTGATKGKVWWSDRFSQIGQLDWDATTNLSPISTYRKVVNPTMGTVYIALSAEVADVAQKNSTTKDPYIILGTNAANKSSFSNGDPATLNGQILVSNLTSDTDKELYEKPGETVTAYEVLGTSFKLGDYTNLTAIPTTDPNDGTPWQANVMYKLTAMETKTITVSSLLTTSTTPASIDGQSTPVIKVYPTEGDALDLSGITLGNRTAGGATSEIISQALPIVIKTATNTDTAWTIDLKANTKYIAYIDIVGRFISMRPVADYQFLYGTYADYTIGAQGTGTINYNMVGVDWDAKIQAENTLKSLTLNYDGNDLSKLDDPGTVITNINDVDGVVTAINGKVYNKITTTKKDQGNTTATTGNEILDGYNTGYMYNASTGDLAAWGRGKMVNNDLWSITAQDAVNGFAKVQVGSTDFLLTKDTHFIVVSGTGTATLKVAEFDGLADFLDGATQADVSYHTYGANVTDGDEVVFQTESDVYGNMVTTDNGVITDVILSEDNLIRWNVQTLFFDFDQTADTGAVLPGTDPTDVKQYALWQNGVLGHYFVDVNLGDASDLELTTGDGTDSLFFTLAPAYEANGVTVYKAVKALSNVAGGGNDGIGNTSGAGFSAQTTTYDYVTVSNLHTGLFNDTSDSLVLNMDNVTVCDVQWKTTTNPKDTLNRSEITNVLELNNAVSVGKQSTTKNYTIDVAVVYNTSNASAVTVYVLDVETV